MPYTVRGKCIYKKDGGAKVGCTKGSVKKYLAALHANASESIKVEKEPINETITDLIKRLLSEHINLFLKHKEHGASKYVIVHNSIPVGDIVLGKTLPQFGHDSLELLNINFSPKVNHLAVARQTLEAIFKKYPDLNRIVIQPKVESRDFWFKLDGIRHSAKYMMILRGH